LLADNLIQRLWAWGSGTQSALECRGFLPAFTPAVPDSEVVEIWLKLYRIHSLQLISQHPLRNTKKEKKRLDKRGPTRDKV
jgi:hypothetical protein